jgi:sugar/nucleoside kinase (ribokinase family)
MEDILVVGSVAYDTIETPYGKVNDSPGGSALYFSMAASFFAKVNIIATVGTDFDFDEIAFLAERGVNLKNVEVMEGKTFRWGGRYHANMNHRDTLFTYLNVFENFNPKLPEEVKETPLIFLANIDPELQYSVLSQVKKPRLTILDTMNFWISGKRKELLKAIENIDVLILNDEETRELVEEPNLIKAARIVSRLGPKTLIIKKGENGAIMLHNNHYFFVPAYPIAAVFDPTGAGDSFAGGFVGYLAREKKYDEFSMRRAILYATTIASFTVEDFSLYRLKELTMEEIESRYTELSNMIRFE